MNFNRHKLFSAVAVATLGFTAFTVQAAQPVLSAATITGAPTTATFTGGATTDNGTTFTTAVASSASVDVVGTINVAAADVGKSGSLLAVVQIPGVGAFKMVSGGLFLPWDGTLADMRSFRTKTLSATESFTVLDDLIASDSGLAGKEFQVFFGYYVNNDINTTAFSGTPATVAVAAAPAAGCPTNTTLSSGGKFEGKSVCVLSGTITSATHLTANNVYLLNGGVFIGGDNINSTELTIDAGTKVISPIGLNFLVINRGSKIHANGSAAAPITFTYEDEANATSTTTGRWGGLILNGNAPINGCTVGTALCEAEGEGSTGKYGGNNPTDSSGNLNYVVVKYPGQNITETNELNGIAFQGVGSGTIVDYVEVYNSSDDGVEFFGGTVNVKHMVLIGNEDDAFDWTFGFSGKAQHVVIKHRPATGDRGIEADNNEFAFDSLPRATPTLANFTFIGKGAGGKAIQIRRGTGAKISNFVVTGFNDYCVDIDDNATYLNGGSSATTLTGNLVMKNTRLDCAKTFNESAGDPWSIAAWFNGQTGNSTGSVLLSGFVNSGAINALPAATFTDSFFDSVDHIGAVKSTATDWTAGWVYGN